MEYTKADSLEDATAIISALDYREIVEINPCSDDVGLKASDFGAAGRYFAHGINTDNYNPD